jgi:hypothetical protein
VDIHDIAFVDVDIDGENSGEDISHHGNGQGNVGISSLL